MNFSSEIIKILDDLGRRFGIAIDWTKENVMPYIEELCQRIIKFETVSYVFWIILCVLGIVVFIGWFTIFTKKYYLAKKTKQENFCWEVWWKSDIEPSFGGIGITIFATFIGIFSIVGLLVNIYDLIKISYLPELYIINFIQTLM
jgi:hypothetical protein